MNNRILKISIALTAIGGLSACGGSGGGGDPYVTPGSTFESVTSAVAQPLFSNAYYVELEEAFEAQIDDRELPFQDTNTLPTSGSAEYEGMMELTIASGTSEQGDLRGAMTLVADFGANGISGDVTNLIGADSSGYSRFNGQFDITNGEINRDIDENQVFGFFADVDGSFSGVVDGTPSSGRVEAEMLGDFFENGTYVRGFVFGDAIDADGDRVPLTDGDFFGARN